MAILFFFILGFAIGYFFRGLKQPSHTNTDTPKKSIRVTTQQQRLQQKTFHQNDSDRIRELNRLTSNQSAFLRLLKQTFIEYDICVKDQRFIIVDRDHFPRAIFEYRDGHQAMKMADQEDGLPLYLYKGLISATELQQDYAEVFARYKSA